MFEKFTSRKWWLMIWGELVGGGTALWGSNGGDETMTYAGLALMTIIALGYLMAEKDVDVARAEAESWVRHLNPPNKDKEK